MHYCTDFFKWRRWKWRIWFLFTEKLHKGLFAKWQDQAPWVFSLWHERRYSLTSLLALALWLCLLNRCVGEVSLGFHPSLWQTIHNSNIIATAGAHGFLNAGDMAQRRILFKLNSDIREIVLKSWWRYFHLLLLGNPCTISSLVKVNSSLHDYINTSN